MSELHKSQIFFSNNWLHAVVVKQGKNLSTPNFNSKQQYQAYHLKL